MFAAIRARINARLATGSLAHSIVTLAGGTATAQLITICAMPIVTRLYTPAQIGILSLLLAFFAFWTPAQSLRYEYALLIARDDRESHVIYRLATLCVCLMSVLAMPALWSLQRSGTLGFELLPWWACLIAIPILFGQGQFMVVRSWALRAHLIKPITRATVARSGAKAGTQVALGFASFGIPGLFVAELAAAWSALLSLRKRVINHFQESRPAHITTAMLKDVSTRYAKFPLLEAPSTLINQLALALPLPMIASMHGAAAAGWFALARSMVAIPNTQIGGAVADVFQMEFASAVVTEDYHGGRRLFYKLLGKLSLFGLLPMAGIVGLAPWLMPIIFGHSWGPAGLAAAIMAPWLYSALVVSSLSRALSVLQVQELKLVYDVIAVILLFSAFYIANTSDANFLWTVIYISGAGCISYLIYLLALVFTIESKLSRT